MLLKRVPTAATHLLISNFFSFLPWLLKTVTIAPRVLLISYFTHLLSWLLLTVPNEHTVLISNFFNLVSCFLVIEPSLLAVYMISNYFRIFHWHLETVLRTVPRTKYDISDFHFLLSPLPSTRTLLISSCFRFLLWLFETILNAPTILLISTFFSLLSLVWRPFRTYPCFFWFPRFSLLYCL